MTWIETPIWVNVAFVVAAAIGAFIAQHKDYEWLALALAALFGVHLAFLYIKWLNT